MKNSTKASEKDKFFAEDMKPRDFVFDEKVVEVFDDMVSRSVPLYEETQGTALSLARHFTQDGTRIYDIGCSTATLLLSAGEILKGRDVTLVGIDSAPAMIEHAKLKASNSECTLPVEFHVADAEDQMNISNASVVFMNYTLQFVRPLHRNAVVQQIYDGLVPNGCFILTEKVLSKNSLFNRLYIDLYYEYKASVGYSDKEIRQKRESLENVLIPYSLDENIELLERCGFKTIDIFFRWCNWAGIVAVK